MQQALEFARRGWGTTHPNPMVGALILEDGQLVSSGFHAQAGSAHAEVAALKNLGRRPHANAVMYVTLEPCCTHGRTPPCVEAIVASGIKHVVVGATDPNPAHAGKGLDLLRQAGVTVEAGILAEEAKDLNLIFNHWITQRRPLVAMKVATTSDLRLVAAAGEGTFISGEQARGNVHHWRKHFPAIAVSVDTLLVDNPQLTCRLAGQESCGIRFVLDRYFRSAGKSELNLFKDHFKHLTVVVGLKSAIKPSDLEWYRTAGLKVWLMEGAAEDFLENWIRTCARENIVGIYIEPGPRLAWVLLKNKIPDYLFVYQGLAQKGKSDSPVWTPSGLPTMRDVRTEKFDSDVLSRGYLI